MGINPCDAAGRACFQNIILMIITRLLCLFSASTPITSKFQRQVSLHFATLLTA